MVNSFSFNFVTSLSDVSSLSAAAACNNANAVSGVLSPLRFSGMEK